ncbi:hypothetical protein PIB30_100834 [Stylosanthes scabra]|uniref:Uncharacterized protein n=1 Tax=Stylosanthes scabra TaxID=79078 RepID=A0ABU6QWM3_9FABA|nr:hypothetical protein [Stylosanthes scabra]
MMISWKPPIMMIEQALGRYVASSGKYVLGVIRDIYWIGLVGYYNRPNELISHRDRCRFTFGKQAKQRFRFKLLESLRCIVSMYLCMCIKEN